MVDRGKIWEELREEGEYYQNTLYEIFKTKKNYKSLYTATEITE